MWSKSETWKLAMLKFCSQFCYFLTLELRAIYLHSFPSCKIQFLRSDGGLSNVCKRLKSSEERSGHGVNQKIFEGPPVWLSAIQPTHLFGSLPCGLLGNVAFLSIQAPWQTGEKQAESQIWWYLFSNHFVLWSPLLTLKIFCCNSCWSLFRECTLYMKMKQN